MEQQRKPTFDHAEVSRETPARVAKKRRLSDVLGTPEAVLAIMTGTTGSVLFLPAAWPLAVAVIAGFPLWLAARRYRLPFRVPASWHDTDWGDRLPGRRTLRRKDHRDAGGLIYLGCDDAQRELWIGNSDARRHIFALGTTGSGKTEFLLGLMAQSISWGSGCLVVDGKGTAEFAARVWSLAKRFGREDDVRVINLTGVSGSGDGDPDAPAGSVSVGSNTLNPFATGTADQLTNMVTSLMAPASGDGAMWRDRSVQLVSTIIRAVVELRDRGELMLDVQVIRDHLKFGFPVPGTGEVDTLPDAAVRKLTTEASATALYIRALRGEFSDATRLALAGFFDSLPGFNLSTHLSGKDQEAQTAQQYGYLAMQLTKPLGTMADDFAHVFRTAQAEVDMADVVYQRRLLVVLLPALQKAASETRALGKVIIEMTKAMMGAAAGSEIVGSRQDIIDSAPTRAASPFLSIFDEVGYYLGEGLDVMAAQARSLGFSIVIGAQDLQAMKGGDPKLGQVADSVIANTFVNAYGATVDAAATAEFIQKKTGDMTIGAVSGFDRTENLGGTGFRDTGTQVQYTSVKRINEADLRALTEGEFYLVFQDRVSKARTFYIGDRIVDQIGLNRFLRVRGPDDRTIHPTRAEAQDVEADRHYRAALQNAAVRLEGRTGVVTRDILEEEVAGAAGGALTEDELDEFPDPVEQLAALLEEVDAGRHPDTARELAVLAVVRRDLDGDPEDGPGSSRRAAELDLAGGLTAEEQEMANPGGTAGGALRKLRGTGQWRDAGTKSPARPPKTISAIKALPPGPVGIDDMPEVADVADAADTGPAARTAMKQQEKSPPRPESAARQSEAGREPSLIPANTTADGLAIAELAALAQQDPPARRKTPDHAASQAGETREVKDGANAGDNAPAHEPDAGDDEDWLKQAQESSIFVNS